MTKKELAELEQLGCAIGAFSARIKRAVELLRSAADLARAEERLAAIAATLPATVEREPACSVEPSVPKAAGCRQPNRLLPIASRVGGSQTLAVFDVEREAIFELVRAGQDATW